MTFKTSLVSVSLKTARRYGLPLALGLAAAYGTRMAVRETRKRLGPADGPVDWARARRVALRLAQWNGSPAAAASGAEVARLEQRYLEASRRSEAAIARYLGRELPQPIEAVRVMNRQDWLEANFASLVASLAPLERVFDDLQAEGRGPSKLDAQLAGVQLGGVFGYLSRRVLGQYDLSLLAPEPQARGVLYFLEPNIAQVQRELGLGSDFRLWLALHEVTHVFEFEAYPWVRAHFRGLLTRFLELSAEGLKQQGVGLPQLFKRFAEGASLSRHWLSWLMRPEERALFEQLQAMMSLVEGFSDHVMRALGRELLPSFGQIEAKIKARQRSRSPLDELLERLIGLDLKRAQYRQGEAFVEAVVAARGLPTLLRVWESPAHLPNLDELRAPERWLARVGS